VTTIQDSELRAAPLANAARLGRQGRYAEAHRVLGELGGRDSVDPDLLDLLARIHAQQGELAAANECWTRAQQFAPDEPGPREGRRLIAEIHARRYRWRTARTFGGVVLAIVLLAGTGVAGTEVATKAAKGDLARQVGDLQTRLNQITVRPQQALRNVRDELDGNRLILRSEPGALVITFPFGLFPRDAILSTEGQRALADLGAHLSRFGGSMSFTVIGHTDDVPVASNSRYADNVDLGFTRARVAAQRLSTYSRLPLTKFVVTSSGAANPPFPNSSTESRRQNRTVILCVRPL
jgi:flagellar motor protein MotB